jgi:hypothetical protein
MGVRRQGIDFYVVPDSPPDKQVRMDVAAFVGFAAAGPVDTPVAVEDAAYFEEIFGPDQPLAWNPAEGRMEYGYLGPAVRAFFRNGGIRCWVVRVAKEPETNRFPVPGLMQVFRRSDPVPEYRGVELPARSPGSWSDLLRVGTVLESRPLGTAHFPQLALGAGSLDVVQSVRAQISPGDLLRLQPAGGELLLCFAVDSATEEPAGRLTAGTRWRLRGEEFWFRTDGDPARQGQGLPAAVTLLPPRGESRAIAGPNCWYPPDRGVSYIAVQDQELTAVGNLLAVRIPGSRPTGGPGLLVSTIQVETERVKDGDAMPYATQIRGIDALLPISREEGRTLAGEQEQDVLVEGLRFTLWAQAEDGSYRQAEHLGFTPRGARYPGFLPSDEQLFQAEDERRPGDRNADDPFWSTLILPRFPLAAPAVEPGESYPILLPIGMPAALHPEIAATAGDSGQEPVRRDGLLYKQGMLPDVFLDPDLRGTPTSRLMAAAFTKRHIAMQKLRGIHAVIPLEEATLICVPDLAHYAWVAVQRATPSLLPSDTVTLSAAARPDGSFVLTWTDAGPTDRYTVESASDPDFTACLHRFTVPVMGEPVPWNVPSTLAAERRYFRVRAELPGLKIAWSNTVMAGRSPGYFAPREAELPGPVLHVSAVQNCHVLQWALPGERQDVAVSYRLEMDQDPEFAHPVRYYEGQEHTVTIWQAGQAPCFFRVRALRANRWSPWSNTGVIWTAREIVSPIPRSRMDWWIAEIGPEHFQEDREERALIHLDLLRLCTARGDLFGILSLPVHYPDDEVILYVRHLAALAGVPEANSLTYGALYVPWLWVETSPGEERLTPPDGPVTGVIAALSRQQGVWHPPAYQQLRGVRSLHHDSPQEAYGEMLNEGINVVINPPGNVLVRSAHSLSPDDRMRMISVRRLMMLVRRLAVQEGMELIFQPNTAGVRQSARMRFERLLNDLFVRGAFAGATPAESYRVTVDPDLNSPVVQEQGRLVIELDVAPVQPLVFMTIRLMQGEGREPVVSEV